MICLLAFCKDKEFWCRLVNCTNLEAASICPSTCNICQKIKPEIRLEDVEGDIVGKIVKASKDHQLPQKVDTKQYFD